MTEINFVTTNAGKFKVAETFLREAGLGEDFVLKQFNISTPEIQPDSGTVEEVAATSAQWAAKQLNEPVVVADAGLSIKALDGFPGPYMKYVNETLRVENILDMLKNAADRSADFTDSLAYHDPKTGITKTFLSITPGSIAAEPSVSEGSTIDRLFVPSGWRVPLVDIPADERAHVWNTDRWKQLVNFLVNH